MSKTADLEEFFHLQTRFKTLLDEDPTQAVAEARDLPSGTSDNPKLFMCLKASILIDGGACLKDKAAISEAISLFQDLLVSQSSNAHLHYNLANGLLALADADASSDVTWYLTTAEVRKQARSELERAILLDDSSISARSFTNLGNAFWKAHRWVEAYDAYHRALQLDPTNGIAATGAVKVLFRCLRHRIGNRRTLLSVAARHLQAAREHPERITELAGQRALKDVSALLEQPISGGREPDLSHANEYERFVAMNRLALSPTIEGLHVSLKRWDCLRIRSLAEPMNTPFGVPALFGIFNVLKANFLAARYLAHQAVSGTFRDTGFYADTLDYAVYGMQTSMLLLSQRACIDILDKIAVAAAEYFGIGDPAPEKISFSNLWFAPQKKDQPFAWHSFLNAPIHNGNTAIIALAELSLDVQKGGALYQKKAYRRSSTHRFTVLHDIGCDPSRHSAHVEHYPLEDFKAHLVESLQMVRSALLYFVEMISIAEAEKGDPDKAATLNVPSHHSIRGGHG